MVGKHRSLRNLWMVGGVALLFCLVSCGASGLNANIQQPAPISQPGSAASQEKSGADEVIDIVVVSGDNPNTTNQVQQKRLVIKNATLQITVDDVRASLITVGSMASEMTGWIVSSNSVKTNYNGVEGIQATITIRVPAERFDDVIAKIKSGAKSVDRENITGEDVTKQYTDLVSQQTNLEAAEVKLRAIMDAAKDTKDVLDVYNELVRVRGQIEQIKGQIKYFEESAAFSSITVTLVPPEAPRPVTSTGWKPLDTARDAFESLLQFGQGLVNFLIWLVIYALPIGIVLGIPTWIGWRISQRYRHPKPMVSTTVETKEEPIQPDPEQFGSS